MLSQVINRSVTDKEEGPPAKGRFWIKQTCRSLLAKFSHFSTWSVSLGPPSGQEALSSR